jgi:hypothetical protein
LFPLSIEGGQSLIFGLTGGVNSFLIAGSTAESLQRQLNIVNSVSIISGAHQLKLGFDYRRLMPVVNLAPYARTAVATPSQARSGIVSSATVNSRQGNLRPVLNNYSIFAQDTWHSSSRLTLTYGLRYEVNPPPSGESGNAQFAGTGVDDLSKLALAPRGTAIYKTTWNNFAPRIGVAYQLSQTTGRELVIRGGFGVFYDLGNSQAAIAYTNGGFPFAASKTLTNVAFPLSPAEAAPPVISLTPRVTSPFYVFDPRLKLPYTYQWNFSVEKSLGTNQALTGSYVAAVGRRLIRRELVRNPNPDFARVEITRNSATSDYHALQLQFRRRSRALQALTSFTWSKSLDIASDDVLLGPPVSRIDPQRDRGPSDFDVRLALSGAITWDIPSAKAVFASSILRDWSIDAIITARSAPPFTVFYSRDIGFGLVSLRPDIVTGIPIYINDPQVPGGKRVNDQRVSIPGNPNPQIGPFVRPVEARQGTLGRNSLRGFPLYQIDLALRRQFRLTEAVGLQFRAELFNILNHPNFALPVSSLTSTSFGRSIQMLNRGLGSGGAGGGFSPLYQVGGPRSIQLSLKAHF